MGKPILYSLDLSPPVRAVQLTAKAINLDLELRVIDFLKLEHMTEEFKSKNPQHTVPTLEDGDAIIWDSAAICTYLIGKYAADDSLYPKDLVKRAHVDQRLHFNSSILFPRIRGVLEPILFRNELVFPEEKRLAIVQAYNFVESFIGNGDYVVGDHLTVADFSFVASIVSLNMLVPIDADKYPNITRWWKIMEQLPYYELNRVGSDKLTAVYESKMGKAI
jgi:glutathione S-transferase